MTEPELSDYRATLAEPAGATPVGYAAAFCLAAGALILLLFLGLVSFGLQAGLILSDAPGGPSWVIIAAGILSIAASVLLVVGFALTFSVVTKRLSSENAKGRMRFEFGLALLLPVAGIVALVLSIALGQPALAVASMTVLSVTPVLTSSHRRGRIAWGFVVAVIGGLAWLNIATVGRDPRHAFLPVVIAIALGVVQALIAVWGLIRAALPDNGSSDDRGDVVGRTSASSGRRELH